MSSSITDRQAFAHGGIALIGDTTSHNVAGYAVEFIEDTVITSLTTDKLEELGLTIGDVTFKEGRILYIVFSEITLASGSVIVYKREQPFV